MSDQVQQIVESADAGDTDAVRRCIAALYVPGRSRAADATVRDAIAAASPYGAFVLGAALEDDIDPALALIAHDRAATGGVAEAHLNRGLLLAKAGGVDAARSAYSAALTAGDTRAHRNLGLLADEQGDLPAALTAYRAGAEAGDEEARLLMAELLAEMGDTFGASRAFEQAVEEGAGGAAPSWARFLASVGDLDAARQVLADEARHDVGAAKALSQIVSDGDAAKAAEILRACGDPHARLAEATLHADRGDFRIAVELLEEAARRRIEHAYNDLGVVLERTGDVDAARRAYDAGARAGDGLAATNLVMCLLNTEQYTAARRAAEQSAVSGIAISPVALAAIAVEQGDIDDATASYERALRLQLPGAHLDYGNFLADVAGEPARAEKHYEAAAKEGAVGALFNLAAVLRDLGRIEEAEETYRAAIEAGDNEAITNLGALLESEGRVEEATQLYDVAAAGGDTIAMYLHGRLLRGEGRLDEAERLLAQAVRADPDDADFAAELAAIQATRAR